MIENQDAIEIAKFSRLAQAWWDPQGAFKTLHAVNPLRLKFIQERIVSSGVAVLDVGCGGGLLSEALANCSSNVLGIDLSDTSLQVARLHQQQTNLEYRLISAEALAEQKPASFDVIVCMELLEHVPDPLSLINACARLCKNDGHLFFSTLNRTLKAYLFAIVGVEYVLKLLPHGTHDYANFIRPAELAAWLRQAGIKLKEVQGLSYNPLNGLCTLSDNVQVNYLVYCRR